MITYSCNPQGKEKTESGSVDTAATATATDNESVTPVLTGTGSESDFRYFTEQFADIKILRYRISGWEQLPLNQKLLLYYLYEAGMCGRDIIWDQNYRHNLYIRRTLEAIVNTYQGDRNTAEWNKFMEYAKRVWFSNGIHHHYSTKKILPEFSREYFAHLVRNSDEKTFPLQDAQTITALIIKLSGILFDPETDTKRVNTDAGVDIIYQSANNYYERIKQLEMEEYYREKVDKTDPRPVSYGLNSKLIKDRRRLKERTWKVGGLYSAAIEKICYWLYKAKDAADNEQQKKVISLLIEYYETGDLQKFDEHSIEWVKDTASPVDFINGFIEVYGDAAGYRGAFESVVFFKDPEASKRIDAIAKYAQWFEDNSPLMDEHKKKNVVGISAKVINVVGESGDASPSTPIGINLPNANWIREQYGSKSVNLGNIVDAYDEVGRQSGVLQEFALSEEEIERAKKWGALAGKLTTDMHEVIGHASGQINPGVGSQKETLKNYASALEEGRADLVALYYVLDPKLIEIGVMPSLEVGKAEFDNYIRSGMMVQLTRIKPGENIEEAHMRNRAMVARWVYEKGAGEKVIEKITRDGKTYFRINDYEKLRRHFGDLLREVQRIKSEGDLEAGKNLIENYGVKVDTELHSEVLERYRKLNLAPYAGFINPVLVPVKEGDKITDIKVEYPDDFTKQMLFYAKNYSFLPTYNY
ncbi:MAG: dihydrofolate reductase [Bacteroidetes bacterium]|nr:dihydrofolate reductase [Bacteroidota bacterium]